MVRKGRQVLGSSEPDSIIFNLGSLNPSGFYSKLLSANC
jgi:hypothetical protein